MINKNTQSMDIKHTKGMDIHIEKEPLRFSY